MKTSFHTHTYLCKHATGTVKDYTAQAEREGCAQLGFSDHCPFPKDGSDNWQEVRMSKEQAPRYVAAVREAAKTVSFPIYCGFECEWDSVYEHWYRDFLLGELHADYLVLGQHWVLDGADRRYIPECCTGTFLHHWTDATIEAMNTGLFAFVAHPDLLMAYGALWSEDICACCTAIIDAAIECGLPLEINGYGIIKSPVRTRNGGTRYPYPYSAFWELASERGAKAICNSDAHSPIAVLANAEKAKKYATQFNIAPIDSIFSSNR